MYCLASFERLGRNFARSSTIAADSPLSLTPSPTRRTLRTRWFRSHRTRSCLPRALSPPRQNLPRKTKRPNSRINRNRLLRLGSTRWTGSLGAGRLVGCYCCCERWGVGTIGEVQHGLVGLHMCVNHSLQSILRLTESMHSPYWLSQPPHLLPRSNIRLPLLQHRRHYPHRPRHAPLGRRLHSYLYGIRQGDVVCGALSCEFA